METNTMPSSDARYAGFWRRVLAALLDGIIIAAVSALLTALVGDSSIEGAVGGALWWLYSAFMESSEHQATIGKIALHLKVTDLSGSRLSFGRATGRYFAKIISALILFIGFLMAGWTAKKQGLHDMIAGTLVVRQ